MTRVVRMRCVSRGAVAGGLVALASLVVGSCGSDDGAGSVERPFDPPGPRTSYTYASTGPKGEASTVDAAYVGVKVVDGEEYSRHQVTGGDLPFDGGVESWTRWGGEELTLAGGVIFVPDGTDLPPDTPDTPPGTPLVSGAFDTPVTVRTDVPVGEPQTVVVQGTALFGDPDDPADTRPVDTVVEYTRVDDDAVVDTAMGPVAGCSHYQGQVDLDGTVYHGEVWYHPAHGAVAFDVDFPPPNGMHVDLLGSRDHGDGTGGSNTIQAMEVLSPERRHFSLDTYDVNGALDADKNTHAKMLLEVRWADPDRARTEEQPAVAETFGTVMGYFPSHLVPSPVSIFHPEDNGEGYTFWVALVDEAAKNEPGDAVAYHVDVNLPDYVNSAVRVTARIHYALAGR